MALSSLTSTTTPCNAPAVADGEPVASAESSPKEQREQREQRIKKKFRQVCGAGFLEIPAELVNNAAALIESFHQSVQSSGIDFVSVFENMSLTGGADETDTSDDAPARGNALPEQKADFTEAPDPAGAVSHLRMDYISKILVALVNTLIPVTGSDANVSADMVNDYGKQIFTLLINSGLDENAKTRLFSKVSNELVQNGLSEQKQVDKTISAVREDNKAQGGELTGLVLRGGFFA